MRVKRSKTLDQIILWNTQIMCVFTALSVGRAVLLARLLTPSMIGLWGAVQSVTGLAAMVKSIGSNDLVVVRDITDAQQSGLFMLDLLLGVLGALAVWQAAPLLAGWYQLPEMIWPLRVAAVELPLGAVSQLNYILLKKQVQGRFLELMRVGVFGAGILMFTAAAYYGAGVWALVLESLCQWLLSMGFVLWKSRVRITAEPFQGDALRPFVGFGARMAGSSLCATLLAQVTSVLLYRQFGDSMMGITAFAWKFAKQIPERLAPIVMRYALPLISQRTVHTRQIVMRLLLFTLPTMIGLMLLSPWLVPIIFGETWRPAIPFIQVMSAGAFFSALLQPVSTWLMSRQYLWSVAAWSLSLSLLSFSGAWLALHADNLLFHAFVTTGGALTLTLLVGAVLFHRRCTHAS